ncbi:MAG: urease accessory protein UreE, partial [Burkholderiales bacterium]|nr:urease accessory protein UreE [Burkholderiales bacterium]
SASFNPHGIHSISVLRLTQIIGSATDPEVAERLHRLSHHGVVEYVSLKRQDIARRRMHVVTDRGTEGAILLDRDARLDNGAVLLLEDDRAVVVRLDEPEWLALTPRDTAAAIELGYFCGNMHWKVRFVGDMLHVSMEGPRESYLQRLQHLVAAGKVSVVGGE